MDTSPSLADEEHSKGAPPLQVSAGSIPLKEALRMQTSMTLAGTTLGARIRLAAAVRWIVHQPGSPGALIRRRTSRASHLGDAR